MSYQGASLRAKTIRMNFQTSVVRAWGAPSDSAQSRPVFRRNASGGQQQSSSRPGQGQGQEFTGKTLAFNLRTKRGRVVAARTQQQDGYIEAESIKFYEDSTGFAQDGQYTTCDCPPGQTPSYSLRSPKMKVKDRWIYTGPINLYLFNIPTPLWLPFGFLPNVSGRRSGPLPPRYGQDQRKGLYLQDWGWYFALNDYTDLQLRASVWSKGSFEVNPIFRYRKRYAYNGRLDVTYQRTRIGEPEDPNFSNRHRGQLEWSHSQELSPTASIQGNINLVTSSDFARQNSDNYNDAVRQEISSNLRYSKDWPGGGQNLNVSLQQRQQLQSGQVSMTLPNLNFSQRSFKPFDLEQAVGNERWFEKITTRYNFSLNNRYSFQPRTSELQSRVETLRTQGDSLRADSLEQVANSVAGIPWYEALVNRETYQFATGNDEPFDFQATHQIPLSASFRINRYNFNLSPNIRYSSDWHISTQRQFIRQEETAGPGDSTRVEEEVVERSVRGFHAEHDISTGLSASTEFYGLFPLRIGPLEGLRHEVIPSLSFQYRPNFNNPFWGQTRRLRYENGEPVDNEQTGEPLRYNVVTGSTVRGSNKQLNLNFSLNNELETKYVQVDSTGETRTEKMKLLDFDLGASYNFARDSLKMSEIDFQARTTIEDFSIRTSMSFSPYSLGIQSVDDDGTIRYTEVDRYMIAENPLTPFRLTRFRLDIGGSFQSEQQGTGSGMGFGQQSRSTSQRRPPRAQSPPQAGSSPSSQTTRSARSGSKGYLDTNIPWSLSFDFSYSLSRPTRRIQSQNATLNTSFRLQVTPQWSLQGRTGYDLIDNELSTTSFNVQRDLGCWTMAFRWVPFGQYQSYGFNLQVKSGQLSQLLRLQIPNSGGDNRLGGFGNRLQRTASGLAGGRGNPSF